MPKRKTIEEKLASEEKKDATVQTPQEIDTEEEKEELPTPLANHEELLAALPPKLAALVKKEIGKSPFLYKKKKKYTHSVLPASDWSRWQGFPGRRFA